jgi:hypothetical protein
MSEENEPAWFIFFWPGALILGMVVFSFTPEIVATSIGLAGMAFMGLAIPLLLVRGLREKPKAEKHKRKG